MSLEIIKAGILDTIQDGGRFGYQHLGINPGGAMDMFSARLSNCLLGSEMDAPVVEMHFPAAQILFHEDTIICITGADFSPEIDQQKIPLEHPIVIKGNSLLKFTRIQSGARCYLSVKNNLSLDKWLDSYSTNLKAEAGGLNGKPLKKGDILPFKNIIRLKNSIMKNNFQPLLWESKPYLYTKTGLRFIRGSEWDLLTGESKKTFTESKFRISNDSDRMGYRLSGEELKLKEVKQLISAPVGFGTIQLLPNGQLIILMADHQTTGGYPVLGNVISVDLPLLAQKKPGDEIVFAEAIIAKAEKELTEQQNYLHQVQGTCKFKMENILNVGN